MLFEIDYLMLVIAVHITGCDHKIRSRFIERPLEYRRLGKFSSEPLHPDHEAALSVVRKEDHEVNDTLHNLGANLLVST